MRKRGNKRYLIYILFFTLVLFFLIPLLNSGINSSDSESTNEWTMFGRTLNRTKYYPDSINMSSFGFLWNFSVTGSSYYSSPAIANNIVYFGSNDWNVYALNATNNGSKIWNYTTLGAVGSPPSIVNNIVYVGSTGNRTYALNATNGNHIWNYTATKEFYASPAVVNNIVYIGCSDFNVYALNATNGSQIWNYTTKSFVISSPAVVNGIVYIGSYTNDNRTYALNATNGSHIWNYTTQGYIYSAPVFYNNVIYVGSSDKYLYALNATNGSQIWNYSMLYNSLVLGSPAVAKGIVYVGSNTDKNVYALNATNGTKIWNYTTGNSLGGSSPAIAGDIVFIGEAKGWIHALNATNGSLIWNYDIFNSTSATVGSPSIVNGTVYVGNNWNGGIHAFGYVPATCVENWTCTDWGSCQTDPVRQYRTCTDLNSCGSAVNKPAVSQDCVPPSSGGSGSSTTTSTTSVSSIPAGEPATVTITNPNIEVSSVTISTTENVSKVSVTVTEVNRTRLADFEIGVSTRQIYQALNISVFGLNNSQIANATVQFRVNISWVENQRRATEEDVLLFRRNDTTGKWDALNTIYLSNDSQFYYYTAITPGFSTFIIYFGRYECEPGINRCYNGEIQMCLGNATWLVTEKCAYGCDEQGKCIETPLKSKTFYTFVILAVSIALVIGSYLILTRIFGKKRRRR